MKTDSSQQELLGKLNGEWFRSYRLSANLKRFQHVNKDSALRIPIKKTCSTCISTSKGARLQKLCYGSAQKKIQQALVNSEAMHTLLFKQRISTESMSSKMRLLMKSLLFNQWLQTLEHMIQKRRRLHG